MTGVEIESIEKKIAIYKENHKKYIHAPAPILTRSQISTHLTKRQEKLYTQQAIIYGFDMLETAKRNFNDKIEKEWKQKLMQFASSATLQSSRGSKRKTVSRAKDKSPKAPKRKKGSSSNTNKSK